MVFANPLEDFDGLHAGMVVGKRDRISNKYNDLKEQHFSLTNHLMLTPSDLWLHCQCKLDGNRQLGQSGKGRHTWLSGLMKCADCGYSIKVNRTKGKYYLTCSGRSNLGVCEQSIRVELPALEASVAQELEPLLAECPDVEIEAAADREALDAIAAIDQKIDRLMSALAESSALSVTYINRTIERLEQERQKSLDQQAEQYKRPAPI